MRARITISRLAAAAFCCGFLAACGDKAEDAPKPPAPKAAAPEKPAEKPDPAPAAEPPKPAPMPVEGVPDLDTEMDAKTDEVSREASRVLNGKAMKAYEKGNYDATVKLLVEALTKNPGNNRARYNLACTFALKDDKEKALGVLRQFQLAPDCPHCFIQLAKATKDEDFEELKDNPAFAEITAGAADRLERELAEASWIKVKTDALGEGGFEPELNDLPAISEDGKRIAVAYVAEDGARSNPNLKLQIIDVTTGLAIRSQKILDVNEGDQLRSGKEKVEKLTATIEKRVKMAHQLMIGRKWKDLAVSAKVDDPNAYCEDQTQKVELGNTTIIYKEPDLTITNKHGNNLLRGKVNGWSAPEPKGKNANNCSNGAYIERAWVSGEHHTILFRIAYCGTDMCEAPDGKYDVVRLGKE